MVAAMSQNPVDLPQTSGLLGLATGARCAASMMNQSRSSKQRISVCSARDVDSSFALDEGEGFETVADWRRAHEAFWADEEIGDDTLIVAERCRVVERPYPAPSERRKGVSCLPASR